SRSTAPAFRAFGCSACASAVRTAPSCTSSGSPTVVSTSLGQREPLPIRSPQTRPVLFAPRPGRRDCRRMPELEKNEGRRVPFKSHDKGTRITLLAMAAAWLRLAEQAERNSRLDLVYETPRERTRH